MVLVHQYRGWMTEITLQGEKTNTPMRCDVAYGTRIVPAQSLVIGHPVTFASGENAAVRANST